MKKNTLILLLIFTTLLASYFAFKGYNKKPDRGDKYNYLTFRETVKVPYPIPLPHRTKTPPKVIVKYEYDESLLDSMSLIIQEQEIIIQGLEEKVKVNHNFLKKYPKNPKLVDLKLTKDSLSLALLQIDGYIYKTDYPIYLDEFQYRWVYPDLTHKPFSFKKPKVKKFFSSTYVNLGYYSHTQDYHVSLSSQVFYKKFGIEADIGVVLLNNTKGFIGIKGKYKIF